SPGKGLQLIARPAQPIKALFNIKETRLLHLPPSPINAEEIESHRTAQSQGFFRTLQLITPIKKKRECRLSNTPSFHIEARNF
ncbi:hypothetical protein, partial [Acetobacter cerevisiae]|uniref:hypothetical protein n=1 Tax=Acetobacter cerevisiae TaxID=178900 RepID=UPI001ADFD2BF